jgi:hypothetical protein
MVNYCEIGEVVVIVYAVSLAGMMVVVARNWRKVTSFLSDFFA